MNIRQLIDELQKFDGDTEVAVVDCIDDYTSLDKVRLITGIPCQFDRFVALISDSWEDYKPNLMQNVRETASPSIVNEASENDICEIGAILRDRGVRVSNFQIGKILEAERMNDVPEIVIKVPQEIDDLVYEIGDKLNGYDQDCINDINQAIVDAFNRGVDFCSSQRERKSK
jgi:hypothetical protein